MTVHADEHNRNQILAQGQTTPGTSLLDKKAWIGQKIIFAFIESIGFEYSSRLPAESEN